MNKKQQFHFLRARLSVLLTACLVSALLLSGCAELRKKFVRKKKPVNKTPHYFNIEPFDARPTIELYTKHYVYWRSWMREILELLGENSKKDKRCISEIVGNLTDMQSMLVDEKAKEMEPHIEKLRNVKKQIEDSALTYATKTRIMRTLEKEYKLIKINFSYRKMEPFIRATYKDSGYTQ